MLIRGGPQSELNSMTPEKRFRKFEEFLVDFIRELNALSGEGEVVLVEGKRDVRAMYDLGYDGKVIGIAELRRGESRRVLQEAKRVIILTDLDREGRQLAARYAKLLAHDGIEFSLEHRKRLLAASRGIFRHVENLRRFQHLGADLTLKKQDV